MQSTLEETETGWTIVGTNIKTAQGARGFAEILQFLARFGDTHSNADDILTMDLKCANHGIRITVTDICWSGIRNFSVVGKVLRVNGKKPPVSKGDVVRLLNYRPAYKSVEILEVYDS